MRLQRRRSGWCCYGKFAAFDQQLEDDRSETLAQKVWRLLGDWLRIGLADRVYPCVEICFVEGRKDLRSERRFPLVWLCDRCQCGKRRIKSFGCHNFHPMGF